MSMIELTYTAAFTTGSNLATQLAQMGFLPLDQGELLITGLTLVSDVTSYAAPDLKRVVTLLETPESDARMGLPVTNEKRRALVTGLFTNKIASKIKKAVIQDIAYLP